MPGAEIIALSEHVDYWNHLGWRDPYASAGFSARQKRYARAFRLGGVYTPQIVVDGREEFVGSDARTARAVIAHAARKPKARIDIAQRRVSTNNAGRVSLLISTEGLPPEVDDRQIEVVVAIREDNLGTHVKRGENAGRKLTHRAVVRRLDVVGRLSARALEPYTKEVDVQLSPEWNRDQLRAVVFLQDAESRHVLGVAVTKLYR